ncbi:MAG TPA: CcdB family protein [Quisquiliibacterium sp.]|nr:CcdB family protein [Quisquiliibacterium sp.]
MPQFDVFTNENPATRARAPYLVDVQSELLEELATRVVVPLVAAGKGTLAPMTRLMPVFEIEGRRFTFVTPQLAGVPRAVLGRRVASLASSRHEIVAALDVLISGI